MCVSWLTSVTAGFRRAGLGTLKPGLGASDTCNLDRIFEFKVSLLAQRFPPPFYYGSEWIFLMDFSRKGLGALLEMTPILLLNSCALTRKVLVQLSG